MHVAVAVPIDCGDLALTVSLNTNKMTSLLNMVKTLSSGESTPLPKNESVMVAESLLCEMDFQIKEVQEAKRQEERELRKNKSGVDYSWLVSAPPKAYEMPQLERLELEELCLKVKPEESGRVITEFRNSLSREPTMEEIPRLLKACILQVIEGRPKEETMMAWMSKSISKLKPSSRVAPIFFEENNSVTELQHQRPNEDHDEPYFIKVDSLPV